MEDQLHTLRMLAQRFRRFGLSASWLELEAKEGRLPCFKAGKRLLFDPEAVERALLELAREPQKGDQDE